MKRELMMAALFVAHATESGPIRLRKGDQMKIYDTTWLSPHGVKDIQKQVADVANQMAEAGRVVVSVFTVPETSGLDGPGTSGAWARASSLCILHRAAFQGMVPTVDEPRTR